jgi:hypothetical protein
MLLLAIVERRADLQSIPSLTPERVESPWVLGRGAGFITRHRRPTAAVVAAVVLSDHVLGHPTTALQRWRRKKRETVDGQNEKGKCLLQQSRLVTI